uniref:PepSY domain-containing protein n=1 Tax=Pararhizobium sp. IMCC3301 TaxID=3067904 RepID=UPI0027426ED9|nr:hypothetical protein [Pararhizobium sp. IMCC3301]
MDTLKILTVSLTMGIAPLVVQESMTGAYAQDCLSNAQASDAVRSGSAKPLSEIRRRVTQDGGKIVSAQLCLQGNGYVYVISVLQPDGQVKNMSVSAD